MSPPDKLSEFLLPHTNENALISYRYQKYCLAIRPTSAANLAVDPVRGTPPISFLILQFLPPWFIYNKSHY